jgi:deoxyribonuclease-4
MTTIKYTHYIGAHINREKTLLQTMKTITDHGGNALQIFASNPRSASLVNISNYTSISEKIQEYCKEHNFKLVIHSPYTINLAKEFKNGKKTIAIEDCYWVKLLIHELEIASILNSVGVVVHVGKHTTQSYEEGLQNMTCVLKYTIQHLIQNNISSKILLETPAGQGTELLKDLREFLEYYNSFSKEEKKYLGICLDTAHIWSAGYDLQEALQILFTKNAKDVLVIHYNNSEREKSSMVDKHAPILQGEIPNNQMVSFLELLRHLKQKPIIILETPDNVRKEIEWITVLYS